MCPVALAEELDLKGALVRLPRGVLSAVTLLGDANAYGRTKASAKASPRLSGQYHVTGEGEMCSGTKLLG